MSRTKIVFTAFTTLCLAATLTGCHRGASRPVLIGVSPNESIGSPTIGSLSVVSSSGMTPSFVSLGAGDALGWAVHQKDVELARAASVETTLCAK